MFEESFKNCILYALDDKYQDAQLEFERIYKESESMCTKLVDLITSKNIIN